MRKALRFLLRKGNIAKAGDLAALELRVRSLEHLVERLADDPHAAWLYRNRMERMDATDELFDKARREFHLARYEFACSYTAGKIVADVACGTGYGTAHLVRKGKAKATVGIDIDPDAVRFARNRHCPQGAYYVCASADATGLAPASMDAVVSFETVEHVQDASGLIDEFARILKPGGHLVCSTPNDWPVSASPFHVRTYDKNSFVIELGRRFTGIKLFNQNSGSPSPYNHGQPAGIVPTTDDNAALAECFIAVATLDR